MSQTEQEISYHARSAENRLNSSRQELRDLFVEEKDEEARNNHSAQFPRSRIMRLLTGNGGMALLAVGAGGILLARPKLLMRAVRMVPMGALLRMFADKVMTR